MPTIILLDVSLSMSRPASANTDGSEDYNYQRKHLAIHGINTFLNYMSTHCKHEFVSLFIYSYLWEQKVPFTREYDTIRSALSDLEEYNKTCLEGVLHGIRDTVMAEWGVNAPCQVILVTDGNTGIGEGSLKHTVQQYTDNESAKLALPFPFPSKILTVCVAPPNERGLESAKTLYERLIELNDDQGELFLPEGALNMKSIEATFTKLAETHFKPYFGTLKCGNLSCKVQLHPKPEVYEKKHDFEELNLSVAEELNICGFLDISDVNSPPFISRHLVLPITESNQIKKEDSGEEEENDDGKMPAFTVLLHGSLKVEGMVALTQIAKDWYGMMCSWADSKKKSNLVLSLFQPGTDILPWLGSLNNLAPINEFEEPPYADDNNRSPFPVRPQERRSYTQNCVVWIKNSGLQADIQKILRNARKIPEKQAQFYKDLNRLRRAAIAFGFFELLDAVAQLLDRECQLLPEKAHVDAALQLSHVANALRSQQQDITQTIAPLRTKYTTGRVNII